MNRHQTWPKYSNPRFWVVHKCSHGPEVIMCKGLILGTMGTHWLGTSTTKSSWKPCAKWHATGLCHTKHYQSVKTAEKDTMKSIIINIYILFEHYQKDNITWLSCFNIIHMNASHILCLRGSPGFKAKVGPTKSLWWTKLQCHYGLWMFMILLAVVFMGWN